MQRLVTVPEEREPPTWLLAGLRLVDPGAEVVYIGRGDWWVGVVATPNRHRRRFGLRLLRRQRGKWRPDPALVRQALLALQGFSVIATYTGDPTGAWIDDFARRDHEWRYQSNLSQYHLAEKELDEEPARIQAAASRIVDARGREAHRAARAPLVVPVTRGLPS